VSGPDSLARRHFLRMGAAGALVAGTSYAGVPESLTERYPDPRYKALDERFSGLVIGNTPLQRIASGNLWAEGPAWSAVGRYLVWSDIPNNRQQRWLADDGHVSTLREPSGKSNGNTFDYAGRQLSCQHLHRRVVRYELDGTESIIADRYDGKLLNGPNDIIVHPEDGAIWFTDPGYGLTAYEGQPGEMQLKEAVYRVDAASGRIAVVSDEVFKPNGLCFSPDYSKLYVADTGRSHYPDAPLVIRVFDVVDGSRLRNGREFASLEMEGFSTGAADGIRCDTQGNIWAACGWVGAGYDGVHVFSPAGDRNRLFITASQSVYALYVRARGAHIS
jgi:gluconolactonase